MKRPSIQIRIFIYPCSHLDEELHQESFPPGQGKAWEWEGIGAPRSRSQTNSTAAFGKRWGWGGGRESHWSPLVIFLMLYCEAENIFIWSQGIWLTCSWRFCVVFEWPWNNSVSFSISKAPVSETGMMNSFDLTLHTGFLSMNILVYISRVENCSALSQICSSSLEWACRTINFMLSCSGNESRRFHWKADLSQKCGASPAFLGNWLAAHCDQRRVQERWHYWSFTFPKLRAGPAFLGNSPAPKKRPN